MILVKAPYSKQFNHWPDKTWDEAKEEIITRMSERSTVNNIGSSWEMIEVPDTPTRALTLSHNIVENETIIHG